MCPPLLGLAVIAQLSVNVAVSSATAFGCTDTLIADDWRQAVLNFHNTHRKTVAEGKQTTGGGKKMPGAKNMNRLYWDCNIEFTASLRNCNSSVPLPTGFSEITETIKLGGENCDIKQRTKEMLNKWWNEVKSTDLSTPNYDEAKIKNFGIMANGPTTGFACTYNKCSDSLLCMYDKKPENTKPLYETGTICSDTDCGQGKKCVDYLCRPSNGYTPSVEGLPIPLCSSGKDDDGMTYEMQMTAKNMATYYRRLLGTGWAPDLKGYAPIAKGLVRMGYECDKLGKGAKAIADKCDEKQYIPDTGRTLSYRIVKKVNVDKKALLEETIKMWGEQSKLVDVTEISDGVYYENEIINKASDWAKMVYQGNSFVGCTVTECKSSFTVVMCQYNGIFTNMDPIYKVGKPCTGCPKGYKCDNALGGGLCIK